MIHSSPSDILFKTLADPTRRALFERLCRDGDLTVSALTLRAGISQPAVSKHLAILRQAGLVCHRPQGRQTHYRARIEALTPLAEWNEQMRNVWQSRLDDLDGLLERMDP